MKDDDMNFRLLLILFRTLVFILIFAISFIFAIKNDDLVGLHLWMNTVWHAPLSAVMGLSLLFGVLVGVTFGGVSVFRMMKQREKKLKKKLQATNITPDVLPAVTSSAPVVIEANTRSLSPRS